MKITGKKLLALGMSVAMVVSGLFVTQSAAQVKVLAAAARVGDNGCTEIPGTNSTFADYNTSFLSVTGYAQNGVHDRSADLGTAKHRKVKTAKEFLQAIVDAKKTDESGNPVTGDRVTIIEVMNDINLGRVQSGYSSVQENDALNSGSTLTHYKTNFPGVTKIKLDNIDGLTIFSSNGATLKHCTLEIGMGGMSGVGCNDIVVRNLRFDGCWQWDNTGKQKDSGWAYMKIYKSTNVWVDHCTFTIANDGNIDIESGASGVTLSWCKFGMSSEEAKKEGSVVYSSINFMEDQYQEVLTNNSSVKTVVDTYTAACDKVKNAGYSVSNIKDASLKAEYDAAKTAYQGISDKFKINNGTMYADMRAAGATVEEIMAYAAYHSKVHLTGSGDREFKDMDNADGTTTPDSNARLQLTLAYDSYQNIGQRVPMIRMGTGHMYNCYVDDMDHYEALNANDAIRQNAAYTLTRCINARDGASIGADTCVFYGINQPLIGSEIQGDDISNMNAPWDSLYATAVNYQVIVNSEITNTSGKTYQGSSWDNGGDNLFTQNKSAYKYTDKTLKKWVWNKKIVALGGVDIDKVSRNQLVSMGFSGDGSSSSSLSYLKLTGAKNSNGHVMYAPFEWEYDENSKLPYDYQLLELGQVKEVVTSNAGAGSVVFADGNNWVRTTYEASENIFKTDVTDTEEPTETDISTPEPSSTAVTTEEPTATPAGTVEPTAAAEGSPKPSDTTIASEEPSTVPVITDLPTDVPKQSDEPDKSSEPEPSKVPNPSFIPGDVNEDGEVDLTDVQLALQAYLDILPEPLTDTQQQAADVVGEDGAIDLADVQKILQIYLGID